MKKLIFPLVILLVASVSFLAACNNPGEKPNTPEEPVVSENNFYTNPISPIVDGERKSTYQADPYIVRDDDGTFYMYCTQTDVYTPQIAFKRGPVWSSADMHSWEYVGDVFENYSPDWGTSGAGVWAPTVLKVGDKWNFYYSLSTGGDANPGIGVATSPTPYGPWTHYGKLFNSEEIGVTNSIDPHVFYDEGRLYMVFGSFGGLITLVELTADGLGLMGGVQYQNEHKVALAGFEIFNMDNYEASIILKKDGWYYLFLSTGTCLSGKKSTYHVVVARSKSLTGPYLDSQGRDMFGPNRGDAVVVPSLSGAMGTGHCAVIQDDIGDYWMLYHGYDTRAVAEPRVLYLDKLLWDETTGMPHVKDNVASNGERLPGPYINSLENAA